MHVSFISLKLYISAIHCCLTVHCICSLHIYKIVYIDLQMNMYIYCTIAVYVYMHCTYLAVSYVLYIYVLFDGSCIFTCLQCMIYKTITKQFYYNLMKKKPKNNDKRERNQWQKVHIFLIICCMKMIILFVSSIDEKLC